MGKKQKKEKRQEEERGWPAYKAIKDYGATVNERK